MVSFPQSTLMSATAAAISSVVALALRLAADLTLIF